VQARYIWSLLVLAGFALGVVAYDVQMDNLPLTTSARAAAGVVVAWTYLAAGIATWSRRPGNRLGPLMVVTCFALLARQLRYSHEPLAFTVFFALGELGWALIAHTALAYPSGRVTDRLERLFLKVTYVTVLAFPLAILLVHDSADRLRFFDPFERKSEIVVSPQTDLAGFLQDAYAVFGYGCLATVFIGLLARKLWRATPRGRRILAPLLVGVVVAALWALYNSVVTFVTPPPDFIRDNVFWWQIVGLIALPLALFAGLVRSRLAHAGVGDLVLELENTPPRGIRDALARALGDPSLEVFFWLPERKGFVDVDGHPVELPQDGLERAVTVLEQGEEPVAALVHDPTLRDEPELVAVAAAAARLALENARLHAEVQAQLAKVKESRARIVAAADEQRRRIERDLHDGAQQRLVALALELKSAERRMDGQADPELERLLADAAEEVQVAVEELRELAGGIHPGILTQGGLAVALDALAGKTPVPVTVDAKLERLRPEIEATAYFVAAEALTNVAKHAHASSAAIKATSENGTLVIEIVDDGVGGAAADGGSGLRGLADRVEAQGGHLVVESVPGNGTRIVGEIPCE
jgi:signal transduction histidine kinase